MPIRAPLSLIASPASAQKIRWLALAPSGSVLAAILLLCPPSAPAQSVSRPKTFEVASIKPSRSANIASGENTARGRFTVTNDTLKELIELAWDVKDFQIVGGPGWIGTTRYDIVATTTMDHDIGNDELKPMLQALLAERFALKVHRETRELTVYSLAVAKGGPKLTAHSGSGESSTNSSSGSIRAANATMTMLASRLERQVGRTVIDNTGLDGRYDYQLRWAPDQTTDSSLPSIFTALKEQLGLRLDSAKGQVEVVVVDGAENASEN